MKHISTEIFVMRLAILLLICLLMRRPYYPHKKFVVNIT